MKSLIKKEFLPGFEVFEEEERNSISSNKGKSPIIIGNSYNTGNSPNKKQDSKQDNFANFSLFDQGISNPNSAYNSKSGFYCKILYIILLNLISK